MNINNLAIPVAFLILSAVLIFVFIDPKRWKWWLKLPLVVIVPAFCLAVWWSLASYKGWPTTSELPVKSFVISGIVREAEPARRDPGAIYLWLVPFDETRAFNPLGYDAPKGEPRSFKLKYSRNLHNAVNKAMGMIRQGKPVVLDRSGKPHGEGDGEGGDGDGSGDGSGQPGYGFDPDRVDFQVYELPPPHPPQKIPE
jgi:hypothetical protein